MTDNNDPLFSSTTTDPVVPPVPENPDHDFVTDLVGEDKKYKTVQELAKSVLHKEMHIRDLEKENADYRQAVQQGLTREEFYEAMKVLTQPSPSTPSQTEGEPERAPSSEQISSLVGKLVDERLSEDRQRANLDYTVKEAEKRLGPSYKKILRERAQALGESEQDLAKMARTKPQLFLELMAPVKSVETHVPGLPRSDVDAMKGGAPRGTPIRNQSYYKELKQKQPDVWKRPETQAQMHRDAQSLGETFFQ
jgi:ribosome-binding protein aMBF1 (putative translation factor)